MIGHVDLRDSPGPWGAEVEGAVDGEALAARGEALLPELRGPFAAAVGQNDSLLLARDVFGERPLYYCSRGPEVWFASRPQELREARAPLGQIDRSALSDYLELGYVPSPGTLWSNLRKVPPGCAVIFSRADESPQVRRFAQLPIPGSSPRPPSRIALRARLEETVRQALRAESRPAVLLSAGLESLALLALMTRLSGPVRSYSVSFGDGDQSEVPRRIAQRFRSDHHEMRVALRPAHEVGPALAACGEPLADPAVVQLAGALREVAREQKVVLTADGAAELFAGHERYLRAKRLPQLERAGRAAELLRLVAPRRHRGKLQKAAHALRSTGAPRARAFVEIFSPDERRALLGAAARVADHGPAEELVGVDAGLAFDLFTALPDSVLLRLDAAASAASLRARAAFLDVALAQAAVPAEARHKLGRTRGSRLLRAAVADLLPRDVLAAPTRSPRPPVAAWLRGPLRTLLHDLVKSPSARIRTLLDPRAIDATLQHSLAPRGDGRQAWSLLALELWSREQRG